MTQRYDLLLQSILTNNQVVLQMFFYAAALVTAYPILEWTPTWMRRPAKYLYILTLLGIFVLTTVYSAQ